MGRRWRISGRWRAENLRFWRCPGRRWDFGPLAGLTKLQTLWLGGTQVADLGPLAELTNLQTLWLDGTKAADLGPLAGLTNLQMLSLDERQAADARPRRADQPAEADAGRDAGRGSRAAGGADEPAGLSLNATQVTDLCRWRGSTNLHLIDGERDAGGGS